MLLLRGADIPLTGPWGMFLPSNEDVVVLWVVMGTMVRSKVHAKNSVGSGDVGKFQMLLLWFEKRYGHSRTTQA